jgi:tRNA(His) 5'-end guanylyltransferase
MTDRSDLEPRMKVYEQTEAGRQLLPTLPVLARLDGRNFGSFTRNAKRPFSERFHALMVDTTRHLVDECGALVGYTQSDEITLAWHAPDIKSMLFFDGNVQKMVSTIAALASVRLNEARYTMSSQIGKIGEIVNETTSGLAWHMRPTFDCRVWNVPSLTEASNVFVWRQADGVRNSVSMAARAHFSHASLHGFSRAEMQDRLMRDKGINWNDYPVGFKRGTFIQRARRARTYSAEEIARLPAKHAAREDPDLEVQRWELRERDFWLTKIANREAVLFAGAEPASSAEESASP